MALLRVGSPVNLSNGTGATFQLDFRQIRKVTPGAIEAPAIPLEANGAPKKSRGGQAATAVDDTAAKETNRSIALGILASSGIIVE